MVAGGGLPKCRRFSHLQWPSVGSKWPSPTGQNQWNAKATSPQEAAAFVVEAAYDRMVAASATFD